jgi:hypothetical protein
MRHRPRNPRDDDGIIYDCERGVFADPSKVRGIDFQCEFFRSGGRHFIAPSPQRPPVLWQAGSREPGLVLETVGRQRLQIIFLARRGCVVTAAARIWGNAVLVRGSCRGAKPKQRVSPLVSDGADSVDELGPSGFKSPPVTDDRRLGELGGCEL